MTGNIICAVFTVLLVIAVLLFVGISDASEKTEDEWKNRLNDPTDYDDFFPPGLRDMLKKKGRKK